MEIQFRLKIENVLTDATSVVFRDPTDTFGIRRVDTLETVAAAGTALDHDATGEYSYTFADPEPGVIYNYWIEWVYNGITYRYQQNIGATSGGEVFVNVAEPLLRSCVSLARYAKLTGYSECALMGVNAPTEAHGDCENPIWGEFQRDTLMHYLAEATADIEHILGYPICPTYIADEEHTYRFPVHTRWAKLIAAGVRASSDVLADAPVDYSVEPAALGPIETSVTNADEIKIFYPDSEREIEPVKVQIASGQLRVWIPRCRLVAPEAFDSPEGGLEYADDSNFLATVDVKRVYTDSSTNASLVYSHRDSASPCANCGCLTCSEHTQSACLTIRNAHTGALDALRANYSGDTWRASCTRCYGARPDKVRVNYLAGLQERDLKLESAVVRLAHTKMPYSPCGCDPLKSAWERDNRIPEVLTRERENCEFGMSDGAWYAYQAAMAKRKLGGGTF